MKRRSPRKSTAARSTPKSAGTAKVATKTPRTASKRARKSTVVPGASLADEPKIAPATAKKNKRASTSKLKTPKSQGQRGRPHTKDVGVDGDDGASVTSGRKCIDLNTLLPLLVLTPANHLVYAHFSCNGIYLDADAAPPPASATPSRSHPAMRPKSFADRLADARAYSYNPNIVMTSSLLCTAVNSTSGHFPPDPSRLAPSPTPQQGAREEGIGKGKGKTTRTRSASTTKSSAVARRQRENGDARQKAVQSTAVGPGHKPSSPGGRLAALGGPRADDSDDSDHSDLPLAQKLAKTAPTNARPKSRKKAGTKDARPSPARRKRTATKAKAKADTKLTADADMDEPARRTVMSAVAGTSGTTAPEAAPGRKASAKSRKRGAEEQREREETAFPVAPPRGGEDVPDVALPPTKRARVLQEKNAPRKRKEPTKDVEDGSTAKNENENGPPAKKPRAATATRYVVTALPRLCCKAHYMFHMSFSSSGVRAWEASVHCLFSLLVAYSFFFACSRSRRGKENENEIEPSKPARKAPKRAIDKVPSSFIPVRPDPEPFCYFSATAVAYGCPWKINFERQTSITFWWHSCSIPRASP